MMGRMDSREHRVRSMAPSAYFLAWFLVGAAWMLGVLSVLTIGLPILALALTGTVLLLRRNSAAAGLPGAVSGAAVPLFYVAFLNRRGPGRVCATTADGIECAEQWNPWPVLAGGLVLLTGGLVWFALRQRPHTWVAPRQTVAAGPTDRELVADASETCTKLLHARALAPQQTPAKPSSRAPAMPTLVLMVGCGRRGRPR
jgi:hypothetical protein